MDVVEGSTVVFIFNATLDNWAQLENSQSYAKRSLALPFVTFHAAWKATLGLVSTLASGWYDSKIALLVLNGVECRLLWETSSNAQDLFDIEFITKKLIKISGGGDPSGRSEPLMSFALSKACCIIHAQTKRISERFHITQMAQPTTSRTSRTTNRIIILDVGVSSYVNQYIYLSNIGLAAQEQNVCIDVCDMGPRSVGVLKQLVDLTKGMYLNFSSSIYEQLKEDRAKGTSSALESLGQDTQKDTETLGRLFVSFLLFHYAVPPESRMPLPAAYCTAEDCCAVCRCHHQPVEIGLVCSCCLAVFCHNYKDPICCFCRVRFKRERNMTVASVRLSKKAVPSTTLLKTAEGTEKHV